VKAADWWWPLCRFENFSKYHNGLLLRRS